MSETENRNIDVDSIHTRLINLGMVMSVFIPIVFLFLGIFLRSKGLNGNVKGGLNVLFWILLALSLSEIPLLYVVRKTNLSARKVYYKSHPQVKAEQLLFQWSVLVFTISFSPTIYGLVYYFMGGTPERFVILVAVTLLCFMLFKPRLEELRSFAEKQHDADENVKGF
jgi:hypothetical protein